MDAVDFYDRLFELDVTYSAAKRKWIRRSSGRGLNLSRLTEILAGEFPDYAPGKIKKLVESYAPEAEREAEEIRREQVKDQIGDFSALSVYDFATKWIDDNQIIVHANGQWENGDLSMLALEVHKYNRSVFRLPKDIRNATGAERLRVSDVQSCVEGFLSEMHLDEMDGIRDDLRFSKKHRKRYTKNLRRLARVLVGPEDPNYDIHLRVLAHMFWQIKRKLMGYEVTDHLLLFLYGIQGGGKTTLIRKIGQPLGKLYVEPAVDEITKKFSSDFTEKHFMANLEEFSGSERTEIEALKKFISQTDKAERDMFSMKSRHRRQNLTLFASSNRRLKRVVNDYSGMRRFWEIDLDWCRHLDFDEVNAIDYRAIWLGSDETNPVSPIRRNDEIFERMAVIQDRWRRRTIAELWLTDIGMLPLRKKDVGIYKIHDLYRQFCQWIEDNEQDMRPSRSRFTAQLEDIRGIVMETNELRPWIQLSPPLDDGEGDDEDHRLEGQNDSWQGSETPE